MFEFFENFSRLAGFLTVLCSFLSVIIYYVRKTYKEGQKVYSQLIPNGGNSIMDKLVQIDKKFKDLSAQVLIGRERQGMLWAVQNIPYFECDGEGACVFSNDALNSLFQKSSQEMLGFGWTSAIKTQQERERITESWLNSVKFNLPYEETYTLRVKDKSEFQVRAIAKHIHDEDKKFLYSFGIVSKVDESL